MRESKGCSRAGAVCGAAAHAARAAAAGQRADGARCCINGTDEVVVVADVDAAACIGGDGGRTGKQSVCSDGVEVARQRAAAATRQRRHNARGNVHSADEAVGAIGNKEGAAGHGESPRLSKPRRAADAISVAAEAATSERAYVAGGNGNGAHGVVCLVSDKDVALCCINRDARLLIKSRNGSHTIGVALHAWCASERRHAASRNDERADDAVLLVGNVQRACCFGK